MLVDIHNHSLYGVDDGSKDIDTSVEMLKYALNSDIGAIMLTPHRRKNMFHYILNDIDTNYEQLLDKASSIGIKLGLGCEYNVCSEIFEDCRSGRVHTMADTDFILMEYRDDTDSAYIKRYTKEAFANGYIPIIAHIERYAGTLGHIDAVAELSEMGAWIQVNADSVIGKDSFIVCHFVKKLLKEGLVDVVASDTHDMHMRKNHLLEAYEKVCKKYGDVEGYRLFTDNPSRIMGL